MPRRTIALGDIHGCSLALDALIQAIDPGPDDLLIPLGDFIDRGPDSRGVIDRLIGLTARCQLVPILGNHDQLLLDALDDPYAHENWLEFGGTATLESYGGSLAQVPEAHLDFCRSCLDYFETATHIFTHARYDEPLPMGRQPELALRWESLRDGMPGPHGSGKVVILGHSSQKDGAILDGGHFVCIDTYCYGGGWLTAMDVPTGRFWQASADGRFRPTPPEVRPVTYTPAPRAEKPWDRLARGLAGLFGTTQPPAQTAEKAASGRESGQ